MANSTTKPNPGETDPVDELIITLLAEGWTHKRISMFCDTSTKTIQRRLQNDEFKEEVSRRKRERLTEVALRLTRLSDKAIEVLDDAMDHEDVKVRMRAATAALDYQERYHRRAIFEADVDERISNLETAHDDAQSPDDQVGDPQLSSLATVIANGRLPTEQVT